MRDDKNMFHIVSRLRRVLRPMCLASLCLLCVAAVCMAQDIHVRVSPDSKGTTSSTDDFPTVQMAMDHAPEPGPNGRLYLHIAPGTYRERVWISRLRPRTTLLGMGKDAAEVTITAAQSAKTAGGTFFTATVDVYGDDFQADNLTVENSAGPVGQAVAVSVNSDRAIFKHCRLIGDQDTLFANMGRQFYLNTFIEGGVDFIFGNATAVFERCTLHIIRPGYLTAQSRTSATQTTGYVFSHTTVTADGLNGKPFFLGRPWRAYSRVVFLDSTLPHGLAPAGWAEWKSNAPDLSRVFYAESGSSGPGAEVTQRVPWSHRLTQPEIRPFRTATFLGGTDQWDAEQQAAKLP